MTSWGVVGGCVVLGLPTAWDPAGPAAGPTYLVALAVIVSALWWAAVTTAPGMRRPWWLMAAASSCWLIGDTVQRLAAPAADEQVGLPDVFWLCSYPLLIAAVLDLMHRRGLPAALAREIRLDVTVVSAAAGVGTWHVLVAPTLSDSSDTAYTVVSALYPLGDVSIFALALTLLMAPGGRGAATVLLICCLGLTLPLDILQTVLPSVVPHVDTARLDSAMLCVNALLAAAALHPSRYELMSRVVLGHGHALHRWRVVLLGFSLCAVTVVSALPGEDAADLVPSLIATVVMTVTVVIRFYLVVRDREQAEALLLHAATHDRLTGAVNRQLLMERLHSTLGGDDASSSALVFLDLDGFKAVNDTFGHAAGDEVLRTVARRLLALFRASDTVARIGGDEFVVLVQQVDPHAAASLGERVRAAVLAPIAVPPPCTQAQVGASVGVLTALPAQHLDADDVLRQADAAMYQAKRDGSGVRTRAAHTSGDTDAKDGRVSCSTDDRPRATARH